MAKVTKSLIKEVSLSSEDKCQGGKSFGCQHAEHKRGKLIKIYCSVCHTRMGCSACVQTPEELLCLECHDWATSKALAKHGHIVGFERSAKEIQKLLDNPPF
jgi:hypothetical protein